MPTFVESVRTVEDPAELRRRLAERIDAIGEALDLLESWTEESRDAQTELASQYDAAKRLARDEIRSARDASEGENGSGIEAEEADAREDPEEIPAVDLLDHPAVADQTKDRLREYSTKLSVYLNREESYGAARSTLIGALDAELDLYADLLAELESGEASAADAHRRITAFAREDAPGPENRTAADVVLEAEVDEG
ncbi:hypothetical protein M0R88_00400 [Halorussus gelatinilyticus]|uniref:Uncharacterized protein n=1 Tax=Halorussus gelatinilyticus TaxID=2937524 RepID=A0A8U0IKK1_9EURY|nr:hypothetical protein [Halorussus gelatinilyticus]UPW00579.1 hypothetical protein M0R88_00400 [Halorussus gelatinilyticus]